MNNKDNDYIITGILNEDGTEMNYPKNPLEEKWDKLYPPIRYGTPCEVGDYGCILCVNEKCHYNKCWKVPEEDKKVYQEYKDQVLEYDKIHNPNLYKIRMEKKEDE